MKLRQVSQMLYAYGRRAMVEGILQGVNPCGVSEYDGEYASYAEEIMKAMKEGVFSDKAEFNDWMISKYMDTFGVGTVKLKLVPMVWNVIRHDIKEIQNATS